MDPSGDGDCVLVASGHAVWIAVGDDQPRTDALVAAAVLGVAVVCVALGCNGDDDHGVDGLLRRERRRPVALRLLLLWRRLWPLLSARRSELNAGARFNRTISFGLKSDFAK